MWEFVAVSAIILLLVISVTGWEWLSGAPSVLLVCMKLKLCFWLLLVAPMPMLSLAWTQRFASASSESELLMSE